MRLNQFKYLIALKEYGTFSKAAQILFISQPSLSAAVKELEEELGFELLHRSRKGITFTPQGELVLVEAKVIMDAVRRVKNIEFQEDDILKGKLRVGGIPYYCDVLLVDVLMKMQSQYPELQVQLIEDDTDAILKLVAEDELDVGIVLVSYLDQLDQRNEINKIKMSYEKLFDDEMVFVARSEHPIFDETEITIDKVLKYSFVTHRKSVNPITEKVFQKYSVENKIIHISGFQNLRHYLLRSDTVSAFPSTVVNRIFDSTEELQLIPIKNFSWPCQVGWVYNSNERTASVQAFAETLLHQVSFLKIK